MSAVECVPPYKEDYCCQRRRRRRRNTENVKVIFGGSTHVLLEVRLVLCSVQSTLPHAWAAFITSFQPYTAVVLLFSCFTASKQPPSYIDSTVLIFIAQGLATVHRLKVGQRTTVNLLKFINISDFSFQLFEVLEEIYSFSFLQ